MEVALYAELCNLHGNQDLILELDLDNGNTKCLSLKENYVNN